MPPKRRASIADSDDSSVTPVKKARRNKKVVNYNQVVICNELYEAMRNYKTKDGKLLCESMIRVPKRRTTPAYYETVKSPIDLLKIQQKLKTEEYEEIEQLTEDFKLLVSNTKLYYQRGSSEYQDACALWTIYQDTKSDLIAAAFGESSQKSDEPPPLPTRDPTTQTRCNRLLNDMTNLKDGDRLLCAAFMQLPHRTELPLYYDVIEDPIDLNTITRKLNTGLYDNVDLLEADLTLMLTNAMKFNEPGSQIYTDAETLKMMMSAVMSDIMLASPTPVAGKSEKKGKKVVPPPPAETPKTDEDATTDEEDASMMSLGDEIDPKTGNVYWLLFKTVLTHVGDDCVSTIKPFLQLPNKRWFADYYEDIQNPISMTQIKRKIKKNRYNSLNEMASDLNLMFENAKSYNADESKIFQNAVDMQASMWERKKELESLVKVEPDTPAPKTKGKGRSGKTSQARQQQEKAVSEPVTEDSSDVPAVTPAKKSRNRARVPQPEKDMPLKKRLMAIYKAVYGYEEDERPLIDPFVELPSKDDYPEYYDYITDPVDMNAIEAKILQDKYPAEKDLIADLKLMFNNARTFNEDGSQLYLDANILQKVMKKKVAQMSIKTNETVEEVKRNYATMSSPLTEKLQDLYDTAKQFKDDHNRILSTPFVRLPSKSDYPEYYEVIKKPMDLSRIHQKITQCNYDCIEAILMDMDLMFDNAMTFNEPDSLLYKDSIVMLQAVLKRYNDLEDPSQYKIPDVNKAVQEIIYSIYQTTMTHQDESGHVYSESIAEIDSQSPENLTLTAIGRNVKAGRYKRLDRFQEDIFTVCENARKLSDYDSQTYEDTVELQKYFITLRDKLCKNGEILTSPAISYTQKHLLKDVEEEKETKIAEEAKNEDHEKADKLKGSGKGEDQIEVTGTTYSVGDFAYVTPREEGGEPHIINVEKMWKNPDGEVWLFGGWFYRPSETFHLASKKFFAKEVFRTDVYDSIPMSAVIGRCHIMFFKDYFKNKPVGIKEEDVYICESRYSKKSKSFKKIKAWNTSVSLNPDQAIVPRESPLSNTRVASVFAQKEEPPVDEPVSTQPIDRQQETVEVKVTDGVPGCTYYEQYVASNGCYKLGDSVYIGADEDLPLISRIEKIWRDKSGAVSFEGPLFTRPNDIEHNPAKLFYEKELFLSSIEDSNLLSSVTGKCSVLWIKDFVAYRPTEIDEQNVYVCEYKYLEGEKSTRKLPKGFKKPSLSADSCEDELYYFQSRINMRKVESPLLAKQAAEPYIMETDDDDTRDKPLTPMGSMIPTMLRQHSDSPGDFHRYGAHSPGAATSEFGSTKKKKRKHHITSFQLFANDIRQSITTDQPGVSFGEMSKLIAARWRALDEKQQQRYKDMAAKLQAEARAKEAAAEAEAARLATPPQQQFHQGHPPPYGQQNPMQPQGFPMHPQMQGGPPRQPMWSAQQPQQMVPGGQAMRLQQQPQQQPLQQMQQMQPQQQMYAQLPPQGTPQQHVQYQQMPQQQQPQPQQQQQQQMNAMHVGSPAHRPSPAPTPEMLQHQQPGTSYTPAVQRPPSPMFVTVEPEPTYVSHSEVYLKYISGLRSDNPVKVSNWEKELSMETPMPPHLSRLPSHWLSKREGVHGNTLNALHALRDVMMKDSLRLVRFNQL